MSPLHKKDVVEKRSLRRKFRMILAVYCLLLAAVSCQVSRSAGITSSQSDRILDASAPAKQSPYFYRSACGGDRVLD